MSDPISSNQSRISSSNSASRTTLDKLNKKPVTVKSESGTETKAPAKTQGSDSVNLSNFDRSKVDAIKAALQQGNYPVNPRRIAENFVALENMIKG